MTVPELAGWIATVLFNVSFIPQIYKTIQTKKVEDMSLWLWVSLQGAYIAGSIYSLSLKAWPIFVGHAIGFSLVTLYVALYFKYRRRK